MLIYFHLNSLNLLLYVAWEISLDVGQVVNINKTYYLKGHGTYLNVTFADKIEDQRAQVEEVGVEG